jgi:hypothetical protein
MIDEMIGAVHYMSKKEDLIGQQLIILLDGL